ncbi:unnamed protein product [Menidia menidia]|uniref:(Atlantic silverside) hypothetical protein n=1 Tax=Menidia menidia TaxID=238744 RepID=A0A8S4AIQ4_9TELE|nr:unnamed protein product [Menidia menidia]
MTYVSDKLYNGYLRRNMPTIVSKVKVREIVVHLPCLTSHDLDNIEAKRESCGNYDGMVLLLDCLKRRENWPEQFIEALEACEQTTLAAQIRAEYNALKGGRNSNPGSPATTVTKAHVHPSPAVSPLSPPEAGERSQAAVAPPAQPAAAPPEPAAQAPPSPEAPAKQQAPQSAADQATAAVPPPDPAPERPQSAEFEVRPPPSTPPPSPEVPRAQGADVPLAQDEADAHQEPEENTESAFQNIPGTAGLSTGKEEVAGPRVSTPPSVPPQTVATTNEGPQQSPTQITSDATDGTSLPTMTSAKYPVQDSSPPISQLPTAVLSKPTQLVESSPNGEPDALPSNEPHADGTAACADGDYEVCLSKPGQLVSIHPQNHASPAVQSSSPEAAPYSGNSDRLEISEATPDTVISTHTPACSAASSAIEKPTTPPPCQENGIAPGHNEPEENQYESPNQSVVYEDAVHVSEEPSILNLNGRSTPPHLQTIDGDKAKETVPESSNHAADNSMSGVHGESNSTPKLAPTDANSEETGHFQTVFTQSNKTKFILTAAGVGACVLLVAWRLKK